MPNGQPPADADWHSWAPFETFDTMTDTITDQLKTDVQNWGEAHAILDDHDAELEIREGQVEWDTPTVEMFSITTGGETYAFPYALVLRWYEPTSIWHD